MGFWIQSPPPRSSNGPLAAPVQGATVNFNFAGGAGRATIDFNFQAPRQILSNGGIRAEPERPTGFEGTTQFAAPSSTCSNRKMAMVRASCRALALMSKAQGPRAVLERPRR